MQKYNFGIMTVAQGTHLKTQLNQTLEQDVYGRILLMLKLKKTGGEIP